MALQYIADANFQAGTLASGYTAGGTSLALTAGHGARFPASGDFWVRVDDEIFKCTARSSDTLTVVGAADGTSNDNHDAGATVYWVMGVAALEQLKADIPAQGGDIIADSVTVSAPSSTTNYANPYGSGNRTSLITITNGGGLEWNNFMNPNPILDGTTHSGGATLASTSAGKWFTFTFPEVLVIDEWKVYRNNTTSLGNVKIEGSNDNTNWTTLATVLVSGQTTQTITLANSSPYRYYRWYYVDGAPQGPVIYEIEFKISTSLANTEALNVTGKLSVLGNSIFEGTVTLTPATPASASATGSTGQIYVDANYIYVCTAVNTWKRAAISTW